MRESFVFFKSFYDAIAEIPAKYQPAIYAAVCRYSLYGEIPELDGVTKAMFTVRVRLVIITDMNPLQ